MNILSFHLTLHNYTEYMDVNHLLDIYQMCSKDKCHYCFSEGFIKNLLEITRAYQYRMTRWWISHIYLMLHNYTTDWYQNVQVILSIYLKLHRHITDWCQHLENILRIYLTLQRFISIINDFIGYIKQLAWHYVTIIYFPVVGIDL